MYLSKSEVQFRHFVAVLELENRMEILRQQLWYNLNDLKSKSISNVHKTT